MTLLSADDARQEYYNQRLGRYDMAAKGILGASIDVTPDVASKNSLCELNVQAPLAESDATLKVYTDSVAAGNLIFDGYMQNRNVDGSIIFPGGADACSAKWIVVVSGSTHDVIILARYR